MAEPAVIMCARENGSISLRPAGFGDESFLHALYASARGDVQAWPQGEEAKAFLLMQYNLQDGFFRTNYPEADLAIVDEGGRDIGRLYTARSESEIRILDITLLPEHRGRGIGSMLIREVIQRAEDACLPVRLMVERFSRARDLYERLGFRVIEDAGTHFHMERDSRRIR